jgi:hypothetical protein
VLVAGKTTVDDGVDGAEGAGGAATMTSGGFSLLAQPSDKKHPTTMLPVMPPRRNTR